MREEARSVVLIEDDGPVRTVLLNRPEKRNAIDLELRRALEETIADAQADDVVRAIVLAGTGGTFCAGGDIATMTRMASEEARERTDLAHAVVRAIRGGDTPVVAAVEGAAIGAGLALALACDHVVTGEGATLSAGFTRVGLAGDMGISFTLASRVGTARARQMLLLPEALTGTQAGEQGLADAVVPDDEVRDRAHQDARRLADGPPAAIAAIRRRFDRPPFSLEEALEREADDQVRLFGTDDLAEGARAFHEGRAPRFRGR